MPDEFVEDVDPSQSSITGKNGRLSTAQAVNFSGISAEILFGGEGAPMTVMAMTVATGQGSPAHISFSEDKVFVISQGQFIFLVAEDRFIASVGDHVLVRRGVIHSFSALEGTRAQMTLIATPAKHDRFFQAMSDLPTPHNLEDVQGFCARFDQSIVGPVVTM